MIQQIFNKGKSFSTFPFKVIWMPVNKDAVLQAGVGVSSRNFKRAVDRNRIKRLMRESYRLQKHHLSEQLMLHKKVMSVFILYTGKEIPPYDLVFEKFQHIIRRLIKIADEPTEEII